MILVTQTKIFDKHMSQLTKRFGISNSEALEIVHEIREVKKVLREQATLPKSLGYQLHRLTDAPWTGYMEFHVADNILVVYADLSSKQTIRLIGIYTHEMLRSGLLD
ncbi:MAG: type II toxin-antitoxin system YafQ family toxin [Streptococcaceae bacterium]|jgi:mRNA interferase YafQ|nr:type II toxin-antitoxin system YafQ family toxin [Streptococcaceae bacterium]